MNSENPQMLKDLPVYSSEYGLDEFRKYISKERTPYDPAGVCRFVLNSSFNEIMDQMSEFHEDCAYVTQEIPFAKFDQACYEILTVLSSGNRSFEELGGSILDGRNPDALYKYAELRSKLLSLIDATTIRKDEDTRLTNAYITPLGRHIASMRANHALRILRRLSLTIPCIHCAFKHLMHGTYCLDNLFESAKPSVIFRRGSSVNRIIRDISDEFGVDHYKNLVRDESSEDGCTDVLPGTDPEEEDPDRGNTPDPVGDPAPYDEKGFDPEPPIDEDHASDTPTSVAGGDAAESEMTDAAEDDRFDDGLLTNIKNSVANTMAIAPP